MTDDDGGRGPQSIGVIIGNRVRHWRLRLGLSQQQLADRMEALHYRLSRATLSKIEMGERDLRAVNLTVSDLAALAVALDVSPSALLVDESSDVALTPRVAMKAIDFLDWLSLQSPVFEVIGDLDELGWLQPSSVTKRAAWHPDSATGLRAAKRARALERAAESEGASSGDVDASLRELVRLMLTAADLGADLPTPAFERVPALKVVYDEIMEDEAAAFYRAIEPRRQSG